MIIGRILGTYFQAFAAKGNEKIDNSILVCLGYDNIVETGQFTKYCTRWRERKSDKKTWDEFRDCFTKWDKERTDSMTTEEASYSVSIVQEKHAVLSSSKEERLLGRARAGLVFLTHY